MPIEPVKIPQNVYVEDRIIGPITLKQLMIVGIGSGISYMLYAFVTKSGVRDLAIQVLCWVPAAVSAAFAFLRINDLSLFNIILLAIENMNKPQARMWSPHSGITINLVTTQNVKAIQAMESKAADATAKLMDVTRQLQERQKELSQLAGFDVQSPKTLEPVRTQMQDVITPAESVMQKEPEEVALPVSAPSNVVSSLPVNKSRIQAVAYDPSRSIDTVLHEIPAFAPNASPF